MAADLCEGGRLLAHRLRLPDEVARALGQLTERWDGKGFPGKVAGDELSRPLRVVRVAHDFVAVAHARDRAAAAATLKRRRGRGYDPGIVDAALAEPDALLRAADVPNAWERVIEAEPLPVATIARAGLTSLARAFAEFADVKVAFLHGHSTRVAGLAATAAQALGGSRTEVEELRAAGLFHDIGRVSVPNGIWDKPGPLSAGEWERVRLHPYYTERVLERCGLLAAHALVAGSHHERLDGSGYHRAATAAKLSVGARLLAAADVYDALIHDRPHRRALRPQGCSSRAGRDGPCGGAREASRGRRPGGGGRGAAAPASGAPGRPQRTRGRSAATDCGGPDQPGDRAGPRDHAEDRGPPRRAHLREDRRLDARGSRAVRHAARPRQLGPAAPRPAERSRRWGVHPMPRERGGRTVAAVLSIEPGRQSRCSRQSLGTPHGREPVPAPQAEPTRRTAQQTEGGTRMEGGIKTTQAGEPIAVRDVRGGGGLRLHVREWGDAHGPPIVFVHGWSQCQLCWSRQIAGALAEDFRIVTFDLRGHGMSDMPPDPARYHDARLWADDLAAVIDGLHRPVLVAWSYGGFVVTDYLRAYGDAEIAGLNLVGGAVLLKPTLDHIGPGFLENAGDACAPDLSANIAAIRRFLGLHRTAAQSRRLERGPVLEHDRSSPRSGKPCSRARSTPTTSSRACPSRCSSRTGAPTRSCCRRWPNMCSTCARRRVHPGTRASATCRSSRTGQVRPRAARARRPGHVGGASMLLAVGCARDGGSRSARHEAARLLRPRASLAPSTVEGPLHDGALVTSNATTRAGDQGPRVGGAAPRGRRTHHTRLGRRRRSACPGPRSRPATRVLPSDRAYVHAPPAPSCPRTCTASPS